ncbi:MAG: C-GCAxxG-C-C family protein [Alphaproteobacteria bacterium]|nr:C-GCAxxG-C-C family protein [Alphaproteobacteria bacterium]MDP6875793.1 C-GCAxxG-C-C family protein [Alphaproteobacteria bacterium]
MPAGISRDQAKQWWLRCVSCSEASATLINRDGGDEAPLIEQASHLFSGGFMHQGHACGHLWGAALVAGNRASRTVRGEHAKSAAALHAAIRLAEAFSEDGWSFTCRENTGVELTSLAGRLRYLRSDKPRACGRKALAWTSQASAAIDTALSEFDPDSVVKPCANCAVECLRWVALPAGVQADDRFVVAGLAGGLGLRGDVCAAISVGVFALSLQYYADRPGARRDGMLRAAIQELNLIDYGLRRQPQQMLGDFAARFGSLRCEDITGRNFENIDDHTLYVTGGGCRDVIEFTADWLQA